MPENEEEIGSADERLFLGHLATAMTILDDPKGNPSGVHPIAFMVCRDGSRSMVDLIKVFDCEISDEDGKDIAVEVVRQIAKEEGARSIAIITDSWVTTWGGPEDGHATQEQIRAAGLSMNDYKNWSDADKKRFPADRCEALVMLMEFADHEPRQVRQLYRRDEAGLPLWGEVVVTTGGADPSSRFVGLLPGSAREGKVRAYRYDPTKNAHCPQCGKEGSIFDLTPEPGRKTVASMTCPQCRALPVILDGTQLSCQRCRSPVYTNWKFCIVCGIQRSEPSKPEAGSRTAQA